MLHVLQQQHPGRRRTACSPRPTRPSTASRCTACGGRARGAGRGGGPAAARRAAALAVLERGVRSADGGGGGTLPWPTAFTHVAFGDLFLEDVRRYREERLAGTGLTPIFPLWKTSPTAALAREMIAGGLQARLSMRGPARRSTASFVGRRFDRELLARAAAGRRPVRRDAASSTPASPPGRCSRSRSHVDASARRVVRDGFVFADIRLA